MSEEIKIADRASFLPACMTKGEQSLLREQLEQSSFVLEFGIGGSTGIACEYDLQRLVGIDSHPDWITNCYSDPRIANMAAKGRINLHYVDIGPVQEWGIPANNSQSAKWRNYSLKVWSLIEDQTPDFVFVDGRFRLSCAVQSLLRVPNLRALGFHDFWSRPHFHPVLEFTDVVARDGQLAVLSPKKDMDVRKLGILACETLFDAR